MTNIDVDFEILYSFDADFDILYSFDVDFSMGQGSVTDPYPGPYSVTGTTANDQTLQTANKTMTENLTVLKTPSNEVGNPQGGLTLTIY